MPSVFDAEYRREAREFTEALNVLNITFDTSKKDARRAFMRLARLHHPDKGGNTATFQRLTAAYEHVTNDAIRESAQRRFDYIARQDRREAREADIRAELHSYVERVNGKRNRDETTFDEIFAQCMAEYEKLNAKRQKTTDTFAKHRASQKAARVARDAQRAAKAARKSTKYILDCQRAFRLVLQKRAAEHVKN